MELAQRLGWVGLERGAACGMCKMAGGCRALLHCGNSPAGALLPAHSGVNKGSAPPGLIRALLLRTALPQPWGLRSFWAPHTALEGKGFGQAPVQRTPEAAALSSLSPKAPQSLSLNNGLHHPAHPWAFPGDCLPCAPARSQGGEGLPAAPGQLGGQGAHRHRAGFLHGNTLPTIAESICLRLSGSSCPDV